jgi:hypothetical protein
MPVPVPHLTSGGRCWRGCSCGGSDGAPPQWRRTGRGYCAFGGGTTTPGWPGSIGGSRSVVVARAIPPADDPGRPDPPASDLVSRLS